MINAPMKTGNTQLERVRKDFERASGLIGLEHEILSRSDGDILILYVANPTERLFGILERILSRQDSESLFPLRATLKRRMPKDVLASAESRLLLRVLAESLTVSRHTFSEDFFTRYTKSVFGAEEQITSAGNHIVFGRRGSGKSSLLLYALHSLAKDELPSVWLDMQVYNHRSDAGVILDVLLEIVSQATEHTSNPLEAEALLQKLNSLQEKEHQISDIQVHLPRIRRYLGGIAQSYGRLTVFLDDFHVVAPALQPSLLGIVYAVARGNRIHLKVSAIETLTKNWDPATRSGLEIPHDAQPIRLDYNLTVPEKARDHIETILDSHAAYAGLPSVSVLTHHKLPVLERLVWVSAGVPRDALNVFSQATTKATIEGTTAVTVTNINSAASEMADVKLRDLELDSSGAFEEPMQLLNEIRDFCIRQNRKNAFLVERKNDDVVFENILKLVDLRLLHVINEGITVREAGQKFMGLILDYGFYIGLRAAKNISLFSRRSISTRYKDLRSLPVFRRPSLASDRQVREEDTHA